MAAAAEEVEEEEEVAEADAAEALGAAWSDEIKFRSAPAPPLALVLALEEPDFSSLWCEDDVRDEEVVGGRGTSGGEA